MVAGRLCSPLHAWPLTLRKSSYTMEYGECEEQEVCGNMHTRNEVANCWNSVCGAHNPSASDHRHSLRVVRS